MNRFLPAKLILVLRWKRIWFGINHVHRDTIVDIEEIIDNFSVVHPRCMKLVNILEDSQDTEDYNGRPANMHNYKSTVVCNAAYFSVKLYSESISVYQIFKIFLGGACPQTP